MGKDSKISWTNHTFNPWWGCTKVAAGCKNCYAETLATRFGWGWGEFVPRRLFADKHWNEPLKWNREAEKAGVRARVFCGSMCDVFEDREELSDSRVRLWKLIEATPWLDWLLLTKRPENARRMLPTIQIGGEELPRFNNVWLGATVCTQEDADKNIPELLQIPAAVRFLSMEPLLEDVRIHPGVLGCVGHIAESFGNPLIHWIIVGCESGPHARPCSVGWIYSEVRQCLETNVPCWVKQMAVDGVLVDNPDFFPPNLRVRQMPEVRR